MDHVQAMRAFLCVATQWQKTVLPNGTVHWQGLDYTAAQAGLALAGMLPAPATWEEIRVIENGALEELNRRV